MTLLYSVGADVSKTCLGSCNKVAISSNQTRRHAEDVWKKTSHLRRHEHVYETMSMWQHRSNVNTTSKEIIIYYILLSEIFRKFLRFLQR